MSDSQPQPQPQPQPQGQQGAVPQQTTMRPDDILRLQCLTEDERQKYRQIMMNFWNMTQQHPAGTSEHTTARQKLFEYSQKFIARERQFRKNKMMQQQGNQGQSSQSNQGAQNQVKQEQPQAIQGVAEGVSVSQQTQAQQQSQSQQQVPPGSQASAQARAGAPTANNAPVDSAIVKHVQAFPIQIPLAGPTPGTPEYDAKIKEYRAGYMSMLQKQAQIVENRRKVQHQITERQQKGQEVPAEMNAMKQRMEKEHVALGEQIDKFRKMQKQWKDERERKMMADGQGSSGQGHLIPQDQSQVSTQSPHQPQPVQQSQRQPSLPNMPAQTQIKEEPQIKMEGGQVPPAQPSAQFNMQGNQQQQHPPQNLQMPPSMQQHQHQMQQQQARPPPGPHSQSMPPGQVQQFAQSGQQQHMQQNRPQINPHQANAHQHQQSNSPHPQSATSNAPGAPVPLSHQAAVSAANRSYTDPQRTNTPLQQSQGNFAGNSREREQLNNPKMPIPRHLNVTSPAPVHMGQARPTMSGPTNGAPGPMGQPVIPRPPPFQLEGEGDRVLSKRKLDELVRQVTGGSEEALTSEVEEVVLQLADDFVDNVISSACKLSKLRESPQLDIRDLQLILERNYNIRIPGYASDEVRTVRKVVPAAGWVDKMKAVNAAKVMGGKADF
ncbi:transcription initiation factor TFIID subunit A-domain-containing protein [Ampelomyces quisqualis]|uniref:Transcription initiation factor TFIID subunit A-domain-containing protein n=1 Tax=Ampelomyces quisqualis TaxID=50730 RepID=A0A6A5QNQ9_AMPQU|nr:transcription initiation factor TFIID subunit A-domain-containing protein [Ampelomyces quisqualis]